MRTLWILGATAAGLLVMADTANSQRGGAVRGGMRGAVVGNVVGGSEGAATGAKIGAVTGATRKAIDREATARTQYQTTTEYQDAARSNFTETPPEVLGSATTDSKASGESVIRVDGKPLVGVTFPADWKQKKGENSFAAISKDGQAYAMIALLSGSDKQAGIKKIKAGLETYLKDIKFDEETETKAGTLLITGTGKGKKSGIEVVFAAAAFEGAKDQLVGAAFIVDGKIEEHYKETVRGICQTMRRAEDFTKD